MSKTPKPTTSETLSPAHKSLFAFAVFKTCQNISAAGDLPLTSPESDMDRWRNDESLRTKYNEVAEALIQELQASSLRVRPISSAKADAAFTELVTIPARQAYSPE